ncbi:CAMKK protein kinase [Microbotryum lychnidis-dioicae p1A1 Lamole]|uniref:CAMKK protein kinase n=1 Tax=Microbotryum lychnidis-dioicae (strain p1A1 Lamole / MvSl-1064) TaxID=683840 RepID=U5HCC3_USTV1|nr:CAMKK protein kinase [Microbotryum lychnidis-dioicae p1A1 Lamole]|eukprot:KDE04751.1 CAMKK protein kinase [Microbotryum lychnidis-dioicae p1A1 Lamole]
MWKTLLCQDANDDSDQEQQPEPTPSAGVIMSPPSSQRAGRELDSASESESEPSSALSSQSQTTRTTSSLAPPTLTIDHSATVEHRSDDDQEAELTPATTMIIPNSVQVDEPSSMIVPTRCPPVITTESTSTSTTSSGQEQAHNPDVETTNKTTDTAPSLGPSSSSKNQLRASSPLLTKLRTPASSSSSSSSSSPAVVSHTLTPPTPVDSPARLQTLRWPIENVHTFKSPLNKSSLLPTDALREEPASDPSIQSPTSDSSSRAARGPATHSTPRRSTSGASGSSSPARNYKETLNAYAVEDEDGVRSVNQYLLGKDKKGSLGKGSYATVERATDRETGVEYAMKEFSKRRLRQIAASEQARRERMAGGGRGRGRGRGRGGSAMVSKRACTQDFDDKQGSDNLDLVRTEIAIMKKVKHPCIATIHEVLDVTSDDALLIVMELCAGGPIMRIEAGKKTDPMPLDEARRVFQQLVLGVAYLHHNRIIHRDIKPDNCLFMADKRSVKLIDFGISKFTAETGDKLDAKGSPAYMPPELLGAGAGQQREQEQGGPDRSQAVRHRQDVHGYAGDIWSLGVTLYALVTGGLPFDDADATELFHQIKNVNPTYPSHLPTTLQHLLSRMLEKDLHQRICIGEIWDDPWTNQEGEARLVPYEENCVDLEEPTREEVERALNVYRASTFLAMSVVAKLKGKRRVSQDSSRRATSVDEGDSDKGASANTGSNGSSNGGAEGGRTPTPGTPTQASSLVSSPAESPGLEEAEDLKGLEGFAKWAKIVEKGE